MKKILLFILLVFISSISFSQKSNYEKEEQEKKDNVYKVMIGTSKLKASYDKDGIEIKDTDLRLVGLLYRANKLDVDDLYIAVRREGKIVDSINISCGKNNKWKDFYFHLNNVIPSTNYSVEVYSGNPRGFLGHKEFYIKKQTE
jgi:hypothetical protein